MHLHRNPCAVLFLKADKKHAGNANASLRVFGLPERIRTFDLQSRSLTRYPAVPRVDT